MGGNRGTGIEPDRSPLQASDMWDFSKAMIRLLSELAGRGEGKENLSLSLFNLFERERERARERGGLEGGQADSGLNREPLVGLDPRTPSS